MKRIVLWLTAVPATLVGFVVGSQWLFGAVAYAQTSQPPTTVETTQELTDLICNFIAYFFWILIVISVIMILMAAFDYVTAGDDTEKTSRGRKRLTYAAIGIAVALIATGFPAIISSLFPQQPNVEIGDSCSGW